ncbi:hypothetical protein ACSBR2_001127 [Camellia fascicularis]
MSKPEPAPALAPPQEEKAQTRPEPVGLVGDRVEKEAEEGDIVESAAAKKKKKKEKEEEKKVAAAAAAATTTKKRAYCNVCFVAFMETPL